MATRAELQTAVNETTTSATAARTTWKDAIPGADEPKMTDEEQAAVDVLEGKYTTAKAARKAAERALADFDTAATAAKAAAGVAAPVGGTASETDAELDKKWRSERRRRGLANTKRPAGTVLVGRRWVKQ